MNRIEPFVQLSPLPLKLTDDAGTTKWIESGDAWQARSIKPAEEKEWSPAKKLGAFADLNFGVGTDRESRGQNPTVIESSTALLRKQFTTTSKVVSARLYVTALGSYQSYLNGKEVSKFRLTPGFTDYRKRVLYQTYDVTSLLVPGRNTVAAILGAGWHGSPLLWSGSRLFPGPDRLRAQLELTFADGTLIKSLPPTPAGRQPRRRLSLRRSMVEKPTTLDLKFRGGIRPHLLTL